MIFIYLYGCKFNTVCKESKNKLKNNSDMPSKKMNIFLSIKLKR